ncbi:MAG TPA: hypothetical protein VFW95_14105 [Candidatus Limnocylindria bacterium]|nr:hypothetical protein [Candidatus Limnocylindria bacterium]
MVIAALVSFGLLLVAWILAPGDSARANVEPIAIQPEPEPESVPVAA